eukprot:6461224-Amphidinium_carterae.2
MNLCAKLDRAAGDSLTRKTQCNAASVSAVLIVAFSHASNARTGELSRHLWAGACCVVVAAALLGLWSRSCSCCTDGGGGVVWYEADSDAGKCGAGEAVLKWFIATGLREHEAHGTALEMSCKYSPDV